MILSDFADLFVTSFGLGFGVSTLAALIGMGVRGIKKIFVISADVGDV